MPPNITPDLCDPNMLIDADQHIYPLPLLLPLSCRFNWSDEAIRAKQLVAAGELVLEDEEPLELLAADRYDNYDDLYDSYNDAGGSGGAAAGSEADKEPLGVGGAVAAGFVGQRRAAARPDKGSGFQIKAGSPELSRLLP
jgi:hypothetical protein